MTMSLKHEAPACVIILPSMLQFFKPLYASPTACMRASATHCQLIAFIALNRHRCVLL